MSDAELFQLWDTEEKEWVIEPVMIGKDESIFIDTGKEVVEVGDPFRFKVCWRTGLKDKTGKEIYEGDVLTSESYPFQANGKYDYHGVVEWFEAGFCRTLRCVNPDNRGISDGIAETLDAEEVEALEVIGSIYENPELLEQA